MLLLFLPPSGSGPALGSGFINIRIPQFPSPAASTTHLSLTSEQIKLFMGAVSPCICGVTASSSKLISSIPTWIMAVWATIGSCWREEWCPLGTWGYPSELRYTELLMGTHFMPNFSQLWPLLVSGFFRILLHLQMVTSPDQSCSQLHRFFISVNLTKQLSFLLHIPNQSPYSPGSPTHRPMVFFF